MAADHVRSTTRTTAGAAGTGKSNRVTGWRRAVGTHPGRRGGLRRDRPAVRPSRGRLPSRGHAFTTADPHVTATQEGRMTMVVGDRTAGDMREVLQRISCDGSGIRARRPSPGCHIPGRVLHSPENQTGQGRSGHGSKPPRQQVQRRPLGGQGFAGDARAHRVRGIPRGARRGGPRVGPAAADLASPPARSRTPRSTRTGGTGLRRRGRPRPSGPPRPRCRGRCSSHQRRTSPSGARCVISATWPPHPGDRRSTSCSAASRTASSSADGGRARCD